MQAPRRQFVLNAMSACAALASARFAAAQSATAPPPALVKEDDPTAAALGYVADASRIDATKQPVYVAGRRCNGCALFQGTASDASAVCLIFGNKQVSAKGWCTGWSKKG